jgi:WD40 repeat protein
MDGVINVWDLISMSVRVSCRHDVNTFYLLAIAHYLKDGVTQAQFIPYSPFLITTSVDRTMRQWDVRTAEMQQIWFGHQETILTLAIATDGALITGSDDGTSLVFRQP